MEIRRSKRERVSKEDGAIVDSNKWFEFMGFEFIVNNEFHPEKAKHDMNLLVGACEQRFKNVKRKNECPMYSFPIMCTKKCSTACLWHLFSTPWARSDFRLIPKGHFFGLMLLGDVAEKTYIHEFVGLVSCGKPAPGARFSHPLVTRRFAKMFQLDSSLPELFINCYNMGNMTRFIRHSEKISDIEETKLDVPLTPPSNVVLETWLIGKQLRLLVRSKQDIKAGEELLLYYPQLKKSLTLVQNCEKLKDSEMERKPVSGSNLVVPGNDLPAVPAEWEEDAIREYQNLHNPGCGKEVKDQDICVICLTYRPNLRYQNSKEHRYLFHDIQIPVCMEKGTKEAE